jgi:hypothetical protein
MDHRHAELRILNGRRRGVNNYSSRDDFGTQAMRVVCRQGRARSRRKDLFRGRAHLFSRLGPHSRKRPEGDEINRPEPMRGSNHSGMSVIFTVIDYD